MLTFLSSLRFWRRRAVETTSEDWVDFLHAGGVIRAREWARLEPSTRKALAAAGRLAWIQRLRPDLVEHTAYGDNRNAVSIFAALAPSGEE